MKIISVGPAYPLRGGIADFNERLTKEYLNSGYDAHIISYTRQYPSLFFPGKTQYANYPAPQGISIKTRLHSYNPISWIATGLYIKKQKPDVVCLHFWMPFFGPALGTIARIVAKNKHSKIIGICHNIIPHEPKPGDEVLSRYFLKSVSFCVAMSHSVANNIRVLSPKTVFVETPHPLYDNFGELVSKQEACEFLDIDPTKKYILFFGLVRRYKGLDLLLEACARMQEQDVILIVAGEFYDPPEMYTSIIERYNLHEKVIIKNSFIPQEEVRYYFSAADIVAQTYYTATQSGITQIAYHFNVPMLVTNVGGLPEIIPHKRVGYVCEKHPDEISAALDEFFSQKKKEEYSKNCSIEKLKYTWSVFVERILEGLK